MKLKSDDRIYPFDDKKVLKHYNGTRFVGEFQIKMKDGSWSNQAVAVYYCEKPDLSKGHKDYFYLFQDQFGRTLINGMSKEEMEDNKNHLGVHCDDCGDVVYSRYRHDYRSCTCGKEFIDGGRDYTRTSAGAKIVNIDIVSGDIVDEAS